MSSIFIQIASYRDKELVPTIQDCLAKAKYPENLRFGIVWQHADEDVWDDLSQYNRDPQFRILDIDYKLSDGTCWARHLGQMLYNNERFSLQIDSHHRFVEHWDELLIDIWESVNDSNAILSGYPPCYYPDESEENWNDAPHICNVYGFSPNHTLHRPMQMPNYEKRTTPYRGAFVSAGFIFGLGKLNKEVPYDPDFYFSGEECALSVRYFTHGYNVYYPHKIILYHYYQRPDGAKHWGDHRDWPSSQYISYARLDCLLGRNSAIDLGIYGLGDIRTLEDFTKFTGVDYEKKIMHTDMVNGFELPCSNSTEGWDNSPIDFNAVLTWDPSLIVDCKDLRFWAFIIIDQNDVEIYRTDLSKNRYATILTKVENKLEVSFTHPKKQTPTSLLIWPYSESTQWLTKTKLPLKALPKSSNLSSFIIEL